MTVVSTGYNYKWREKNTILTATHVLRPPAFEAPTIPSSKSAATSIHRIISSTIRLWTGCSFFFALEADSVASDSSTSTEYAKSAPLFSERRAWRRGTVWWAVSPPTNCNGGVSWMILFLGLQPYLIKKCDPDEGLRDLLDPRNAREHPKYRWRVIHERRDRAHCVHHI